MKTPQQLQAFVAAAHHRSLRAAARELGVTQPAVTARSASSKAR